MPGQIISFENGRNRTIRRIALLIRPSSIENKVFLPIRWINRSVLRGERSERGRVNSPSPLQLAVTLLHAYQKAHIMKLSRQSLKRVLSPCEGYCPAAGAQSVFLALTYHICWACSADEVIWRNRSSRFYSHRRVLKSKPLLMIAATNSNEPHMNDEPPKICAEKNLPSSL